MTIANNLDSVRQQIAKAAATSSYKQQVKLLAVSKTKPAELIRSAYEAGQTEFGENYLQEALDKQKHLQDLPLTWHFIGPIQSNKTKQIAQHFDWVHSVDRLKVATRLNEARAEIGTLPLNICLQVNISSEASKSGVSLTELSELASAICSLPHLSLRGIMAIPAPTEDQVQQRANFAQLASALQLLQKQLPEAPLDTLSMGMSNDLEAAILEGATYVRVGTAIFGQRPPVKPENK
ncbi:YggS family pyridoxal phosphate-dependent enzyme [Endozoicomonas sp. SM1973]|uniref:Pyridoxal phosphate homeostasis protein n=1 Tax=Spartinivicinus marinus TaxID=2994442 RepID=A0A853I3I3_9GAMM|nr:YggS family pyridoxal phosphate-dependent enzyme [Spartinivicinus marinus]MCX4026677.1 YggS family pyridoxal phosphate-dependent enzyme [Spartinivicinus marinus]NYZ64511.1 YggS family pyridoxal phosphate-dependent enzyme [Spartinivicinus marinus]